MAASNPSNQTIAQVFQFLEDLPFGSIAAAIMAGGANVPADVSAGEAVVQAIVKDFFSGSASSSAAAPAATPASGS